MAFTEVQSRGDSCIKFGVSITIIISKCLQGNINQDITLAANRAHIPQP